MGIWIGILRHALTALGGSLVTSGTMNDGDLQAAIGAVLTIVGVVASVLNKRQSQPPSVDPHGR